MEKASKRRGSQRCVKEAHKRHGHDLQRAAWRQRGQSTPSARGLCYSTKPRAGGQARGRAEKGREALPRGAVGAVRVADAR